MRCVLCACVACCLLYFIFGVFLDCLQSLFLLQFFLSYCETVCIAEYIGSTQIMDRLNHNDDILVFWPVKLLLTQQTADEGVVINQFDQVIHCLDEFGAPRVHRPWYRCIAYVAIAISKDSSWTRDSEVMMVCQLTPWGVEEMIFAQAYSPTRVCVCVCEFVNMGIGIELDLCYCFLRKRKQKQITITWWIQMCITLLICFKTIFVVWI